MKGGQGSSAESSFQIGDEFGPEETAEHFDRIKKLPAISNPAALLRRDSAAWNDAMQVWMLKVLSPGMPDRQKAVCREHEISEATYYLWKVKNYDQGSSEAA